MEMRCGKHEPQFLRADEWCPVVPDQDPECESRCIAVSCTLCARAFSTATDITPVVCDACMLQHEFPGRISCDPYPVADGARLSTPDLHQCMRCQEWHVHKNILHSTELCWACDAMEDIEVHELVSTTRRQAHCRHVPRIARLLKRVRATYRMLHRFA